ncbi:uncharacterized protein LOC126908075 [Daktulosphaira vitifoliae]|uniref:uncharacterized protein LOC126908075 n=1 Tax=Daktulosphaira vitifoliae TaxID=58002 RepID=UPI0021AAA893|nr:uncharacterized protein LOC126908075 [Daktulosphaira vitifoliae]
MVNPSTESILNQMTNLAMDIALDYVLPASPMSDVCKSDLLDMEREVAAAVNSVNGLLGSGLSCCGRPPADLCKKNSYIGAAGCDSCTACVARQIDNKSAGSASGSSTASSGTAETTMDISWCQFDGCEFDTADNSYLDICDWIFYADRYALTDENREKVQKAFQMVPPGEVTGYVAPPLTPASSRGSPSSTATASSIKSEPDDDYLWSSDNHLQPIILKAEPDADILQITELDHSYLQTGATLMPQSSAASSPVKHHHHHNLDMLGLVTPPPSRSQSSEEEEIDVVNDSWDTPDTPRKGATMADIMKRGIVKKRDPPVTKWKNTVKRKHKTTAAAAAASSSYPMPPPPPKKVCGGLSLLDRYKKDTNWKDNTPASSPGRLDDLMKNEPLTDEDEDYDIDAEFENLMKNEPEDIFDDEFDDDDENDVDWEKIMRNTGGSGGKAKPSNGNGSSCSSSSSSNAGRKKKKKKKGGTKGGGGNKHHQSSTAGKKVKYEGGGGHSSSSGGSSVNGGGAGYSYKTKLMDPVKRALHNDLEKSRRVETSMLFMNLSMQVSFLDDNRKIPSKLSILRGAKRECDLMMLDERRLLSEKHVMQQKQRMLRERLFELRREQYHRRYGKSQQ